MKTTSLLQAATVALVLSGSWAFAQDNVAVVSEPVAPAASAPTTSAPAPDHAIYLAKLPAPAELMKSASAQGSSITRIDQTSDSLVVTYQYSNGRTSTFAYRLLSAAGDGSPEPIGTVASGNPGTPSRVVYAAAPQTTVVYADAPAYYAPGYYYRSYDPGWDFFAPLALGFGLGWAGHGGWHGGGGWHNGGGWHGGGHGGGWHH